MPFPRVGDCVPEVMVPMTSCEALVISYGGLGIPLSSMVIPTSFRVRPFSFCALNSSEEINCLLNFVTHPSPAYSGEVVSSISLPYKQYPISSRRVSRAPIPTDFIPYSFPTAKIHVQRSYAYVCGW